MAIALAFTSCKKEGCTDPSATNYDPDAKKDDGSCEYAVTDTTGSLKLHIHPAWDSLNDLTLGNENLLMGGRKIILDVAQFYVCDIKLIDSNDNLVSIDTFLLVKGDQHMYNLGEVPIGDYKGFTFMVGVDSTTNVTRQPSDYASGHPLGFQSPSMWWTWSNGYIHYKFEGRVDTTAGATGAADVPFEWHIGHNSYQVPINHFSTEAFTVAANGTQVDIHTTYSGLFHMIDLGANLTAINGMSADNPPVVMDIRTNVHDHFIGHGH